MAKKFREKLRKLNPFTRPATLEELPKPLPANPDQRLVRVYVEGYEDVAFWRGIFDHFQNPYMRFEISVPNRADLPKGKKVLMGMIPRSSDELILCVDSDFDFLFADRTEQSREVNNARYMFHTYAYATENFLCYAPSLHNICVKATKNDTRIFDFVRFMHEYSCTIYPLFLWYAYSAQLSSENVFPLIDFKSAVRIGYLDLADNGEKTLEWLRRNVAKREEMLRRRNPKMIEPMKEFEEQLKGRGLTPENAYLFMHGHTLMDNVVMILLNSLKTERAITTKGAFELPTAETFAGLQNYVDALNSKGFLSAFGNSLLITVTAVALILVCCSMCAWFITRVSGKVSKLIYFLFVFSMVVPFQMLMFTLSATADKLNLDMPINLCIIYLGFGAGLAVFMFCGFMRSVPVEIEEAAMIDGCNPLQTFFRIVFPILKPTLISVGILLTMWVWNDYLLPYLVLDRKKYMTIPILIQYFQGSFGRIEMGPMMACIIMTVLPVIIVYLACQKHIIKGVVAGAVKG